MKARTFSEKKLTWRVTLDLLQVAGCALSRRAWSKCSARAPSCGKLTAVSGTLKRSRSYESRRMWNVSTYQSPISAWVITRSALRCCRTPQVPGCCLARTKKATTFRSVTLPCAPLKMYRRLPAQRSTGMQSDRNLNRTLWSRKQKSRRRLNPARRVSEEKAIPLRLRPSMRSRFEAVLPRKRSTATQAIWRLQLTAPKSCCHWLRALSHDKLSTRLPAVGGRPEWVGLLPRWPTKANCLSWEVDGRKWCAVRKPVGRF